MHYRRSSKSSNSAGFTLVELLIVIVVIAVLAAITLVAYNNISKRAAQSALKSDLSQTATQLGVYQVDNGAYPLTNAVDANGGGYVLKHSSDTIYQYTSSDGTSYLLTASSSRAQTSYCFSSTAGSITDGPCAGHQDLSSGAVATISFVSKSNSDSNVSGNQDLISINKPAGVTTGDLLIASVQNWDDTSRTSAINVPAGWTAVVSSLPAESYQPNIVQAVFYKFVTAGDPSSWTWTVSNSSSSNWMSGGISAYRGVDTTTPFDVPAATNMYHYGVDSGSAYQWIGIHTVTNGAMVVALSSDTGAQPSSITDPTGFTRRYVAGNVAAWDKVQTNAGAVSVSSNNTMNQYDSMWTSAIVVLRPKGGTPSSNLGGDIGYVSQSYKDAGNGATSAVINKPAGVANGNLLIANVQSYSGTSNAITITPPAGWSAAAGPVRSGKSGGYIVQYVFYKVASSEGASWTFTLTSGGWFTGVVSAYSGVDTTTPLDVAAKSASCVSGDNGLYFPLPKITIAPASTKTMLVMLGSDAGYNGANIDQGGSMPEMGWTARYGASTSNVSSWDKQLVWPGEVDRFNSNMGYYDTVYDANDSSTNYTCTATVLALRPAGIVP